MDSEYRFQAGLVIEITVGSVQGLQYLFWEKSNLFWFGLRHVEVRTGGPKGYIFTIKVSEDIAAGSVGFSLVQRKWSCVSLTSAIDGKS